MNIETRITKAREAVQEAAQRLATVTSGITFARQNPAEVTMQEARDLLAQHEALCQEVDRLCKVYDRLVARAEAAE